MDPIQRQARILAIVNELTPEGPHEQREYYRKLLLRETEFVPIGIQTDSVEKQALFEELRQLFNEV